MVRVSQLETRLLSVPGILDVEDTSINGGTGNLALDRDAVPVMGGLRNA